MKEHIGITNFKKDLQKSCKKHKIKLLLKNTATIDFNDNKDIQVSGYFDSDNKELAVATKKNTIEWLEILIHESCHLDQYTENSIIWNCCFFNGIDSGIIIDLWLSKVVELKPKYLNLLINNIIDLERDCDKRAIEKIKKYELTDIIDLNRYIQKSNAYHLSYISLKRLRKWTAPLKAAYNIKEVVDSFSTKMSSSYKLSAKQFNLIKKYCY